MSDKCAYSFLSTLQQNVKKINKLFKKKFMRIYSRNSSQYILVNIIRNINILHKIFVIGINSLYSFHNYQYHWNYYNASHLIVYLRNYFLAHVC